PRCLGAIELEVLVDREVRLRLEQLEGVGNTLAVALLEAIEYGEHRLEPSFYDRIIELITKAFELSDVAGKEVAARCVELLEVAIEHKRRDRIVDRRLAIMRTLDHIADELADAPMALRRSELLNA